MHRTPFSQFISRAVLTVRCRPPLPGVTALALLFSMAWALPTLTQDAAAEQARWQAELMQLLLEIDITEERQTELRQEIAELDSDRAALNQALIETNQNVQQLERDLDLIEARMDALIVEEADLNRVFRERRNVLAEVLAVLQRMGRAPPPAIIIQPEDALAAVRSAILLGAVVSEIWTEAEALAVDIERLIALRQEQETERALVIEAANDMAEQHQRLELLVEERRQALDQTGESLRAEQERLGALALEAQTLEELIGAFEIENGPDGGVQLAAGEPGAGAIEPGLPLLFGEADRISPALPFASARGLLPRPANGDLIIGYGAEDDLGGLSQGISIATRPGARVAAPADGWVEFAGPYRSYGNLLIIDAGGGYRIVLAGMERIDVQRGQFVLAGEPVGAMRSPQVAAAADVALGMLRPVLYVEFRRDSDSINPDPWWADPY